MKKWIFLGYPVLEFLTALFFIVWLGFGWTFVIYIAGIPIGWLTLRAAGRKALSLAKAQQTPSRALSFRFVTGMLLMIPGFWTDVLALLCCVPLVQARIAAPFSFLHSSASNLQARMNPWGEGAEVVEGVVIHDNDDPTTPNSIGSGN